MEFILVGWQILLIVSSVVAAAVWLKSTLQKQRTKDLTQLVDTRGERIHDLEKEITELRTEMAELRGEMNAVLKLQTEEIALATAKEVVIQLTPFLTRQ